MRCLLLLAGLVAVPAFADPAADLRAVQDDAYRYTLDRNPLFASLLGNHAKDDELGDPSLAEADRQTTYLAGILKRLAAIPDTGLTPAGRTEKAIVRRNLADTVEANGFKQRAINFGNSGGWYSQFADLPVQLPFYKRADYDNYIARLDKVPAYAEASTAVARQALKDGMILSCAVLGGVEKQITGEVFADPAKSRFYQPFLTRPASIADADWAALQARAQVAIRDKVNPAYTRYAAFYRTEYAPKCRQTIGATDLPGGKAWYEFLIRQQTTTAMTAEQIHGLGLSEVTRIRGEMDALVAATGFKGDRTAYIVMLRTDPKYYAKTPHELMAEVGLMTKTIDGQMPKLFDRLPRLPYTIREIPAATAEGSTTAYYQPGSPANGIAGTYYVNTTQLDQRPLFELPALTLHEAVPGHHNQISLQQELEITQFRQNLTFFTAFVEGWGLYSERLGIEMGIYDTPEKQMGRLSYEMWRACRLVVDTGIHAQGWSKQRAVDFMTENTALSAANIDAEVNRYIATPGQALAYKLGELTIRRLRTKAETELGAKFDIRAFHDAVLGQGPVPLDVLETQIGDWIAARKAI